MWTSKKCFILGRKDNYFFLNQERVKTGASMFNPTVSDLMGRVLYSGAELAQYLIEFNYYKKSAMLQRVFFKRISVH